MKKTLLLIAILIPLAFSGCGSEQSAAPVEVTTEVTTTEVATTESTEDKAIKSLKEFVGYAEKFNKDYKEIYDLEMKIWNNCTEEKKADDTDAYTMDSNGKFYDDPFDALTRFWSTMDYSGMYTGCETYQMCEQTAYKNVKKYKDNALITSLDDKISEINSLIESQMSYEGQTFNILEYSVNIDDNYHTIKEDLDFINSKLD